MEVEIDNNSDSENRINKENRVLSENSNKEVLRRCTKPVQEVFKNNNINYQTEFLDHNEFLIKRPVIDNANKIKIDLNNIAQLKQNNNSSQQPQSERLSHRISPSKEMKKKMITDNSSNVVNLKDECEDKLENIYKNQLNKSNNKNDLLNKKLKDSNFNQQLAIKLKEEEINYLKRKVILNNNNIDELFFVSDFLLHSKNNQMKIKQISNWQDLYSTNKSKSVNNSQYFFVKKNDNNRNSKNINKNNNNSIDHLDSFINKSIIIKNKVIRFNDLINFNLKTLSVKLEIKFSMTGESSIWFFSRIKHNIEIQNKSKRESNMNLNNSINNNINNDSDSENNLFSSSTTVCYINKELDSCRKFISFSILTPNTNNKEFFVKTLKKQEIPKHETHDFSHDVSDLTMVFIDQGDRICYVELIFPDRKYKFEAGFYIPIEDFSNIFIGASGDMVCIKSVIVSHMKKRTIDADVFGDKQYCSCCSIF